MTGSGAVTSDCDDSVLTITINRPEQRNALDLHSVRTLIEMCAVRAREPDVRAVILTGGDQAFCAGADLQSAMTDPEKPSVEQVMDIANDLIQAILDLPVPVIAKVRGSAAGFGLSLALAADIVVAANSAKFVMSFIRRAAMPDGAASLLVPASIGRARATAMAMLGERMSAPEAQSIGLIHRACPDGELDTTVDELARRFARGPRQALQLTKQAVNAATIGQLDSALQREREGQMQLLMSADFLEAVFAFAQRREPRFNN